MEVIDPIEGWVSPRLGIRFEMAEELQIFAPSGEGFMTSVELAQLRDQERQRAEQAEARSQMLEARLRELGIDPDA